MIRSQHGVEIPTSLEEWCDPERMALLVYDMQVGICRQVAGADAIVEKVGTVLEAARGRGMRIAFTRHLSLPRRWLGMVQLRTAMAWQRRDDPDTVEPWFLRDAEATQIVPALAPRADEAVFDKVTMSAFDSTALGFALRDCGVRAIALTGIALEIGIEPTARQAADNGLVSVVIEDACGFGDAAARDRAIATLSFIGDTLITQTDPFCAALRT
jgi:nicotinamidase-related amidase